ncbi:aldehyde dehydrogenase family protein [Rhodococcus sp. T2V]|uniref:aldehyde dehydrogenase family protein n=1 Tax=Rhodococcus sp. T2V TaxID=3034164 RepID=UPI0023E1DA5C|nr:aldehyde dehydrogenase family protein [Rhodococcus sp. T2V]MDF3309566.1 aldehyde dehydrogenase family protein [Rhodococcus sp. T2V]
MEHIAELQQPFIAGERVTSGADQTIAVINPATESQIAQLQVTSESLVDQAVEAAAQAQRRWVKLTPDARGAIIWKWGELVAQHSEELAQLITAETGKPITDARGEAMSAPRVARYWAGMTDKINGAQLPVTPGHLSYTIREPLGVVAGIMPWNGPVASCVGRGAAALATGNGVVLKPSEFSSLSALRIADLASEAGVPAGLLSVVTGAGEVGGLLASHPGIGGVTFTGGVTGGRRVNLAAAESFKKVTLELGGKAPSIVFADADLDAALQSTLYGIFGNAGQVCVATSRLLLHKSIADGFTERLVAATQRIRVGAPSDEATKMGPLISAQQYESVSRYLELGNTQAQLLTGGGRPKGYEGSPGYYLAPTIYRDDQADSAVAREEVFGPVLTVIPFDSEEEAVDLANGVDLGLSANIWTKEVGTALRVAESVEAGTIWCNATRVMDPALPFGGFKNSGVGNAFGEGAVEGQTRLRRITVRFDAASESLWDI